MPDELNTTENKDLPPNQYQCWNCGGIFNKGRSDEEAEEELRNRMPDEKLEECAVVCGDCYNEIIIIGRDVTLADAEQIICEPDRSQTTLAYSCGDCTGKPGDPCRCHPSGRCPPPSIGEIRFDPPLTLPLDATSGQLFDRLCRVHAALVQLFHEVIEEGLGTATHGNWPKAIADAQRALKDVR